MRRSAAFWVLAWALVVSGAARGEGVRVEPGKWKIESTAVMPMLPQPRVVETTQCIEKGEFTPEDLMENAGECTYSDVAVEGQTIRWKLSCKAGEGASQGEGHFTSKGKTLNGEMQMSMTMDGQSMSFSTTWTGRHVGACD